MIQHRVFPNVLRRTHSISFNWIATVFLVVFVVVQSGCAVFNRENTPVFNLVEDNLWPKSTGARVVAFPAVLVLGCAAALVDASVVHPSFVIDDAWGDTRDLLWDRLNWDNEYMTECAALPWRTVCTPLIFTGDFLGRAFFDISDRTEGERLSDRTKRNIDTAESLLNKGEAGEAFALIQDPGPELYRLSHDMQARWAWLLLRAAHDAGRLRELPEDLFFWHQQILNTSYTERLEGVLRDMQTAEHPYDRWIAFRLDLNLHFQSEMCRAIVRAAFDDPDPQVRLMVATHLNQFRSDEWIARQVRPILQEVARNDPDLLIQAYADYLLTQLSK